MVKTVEKGERRREKGGTFLSVPFSLLLSPFSLLRGPFTL